MTALILAAIAFMAIHAIPATPARRWIISRIGEGPYLGAFSFASLVLMGTAYGAAAPAPPLWTLGFAPRVVLAFAMLAPVWLLVAANSERNAASVGGGSVLEASATPRGIFTVTRHPLMIGIAAWAVLHLLANPDLPSFVLFGSIAATALVGAKLQDRRKEVEIGTAWRRYLLQTSFMPFAAVREGRTRLDTSDVTWWRAAIALALWALLLTSHDAVFGVSALF